MTDYTDETESPEDPDSADVDQVDQVDYEGSFGLDEEDPLEDLRASSKQASQKSKAPVTSASGLLDTLRASFGLETKATKPETGIDLNKESNVVELEDAGLNGHMAEARELLNKQAHSKTHSNASAHSENMRAASATLKKLTATTATLKQTLEMFYLQTNNARKISEGVKPHGFPEVKAINKDAAASVMQLHKKLDEQTQEMQSAIATLENVSKELVVQRRKYEEMVDTLLRPDKAAAF